MLEATPAVHPDNELPRTPKKTKRPQDGSPKKRRKRDNKKGKFHQSAPFYANCFIAFL